MKTYKVYDRACAGCIHFGWANSSLGCCNYIFNTGHRRPCPPGKGCTVKTKKRRKEKKDG